MHIFTTLLVVICAATCTHGSYLVTAPKIARIAIPYPVNVLLSESRTTEQNCTISLQHQTDSSQKKTIQVSFLPGDVKKDVVMTVMPGELILGKYLLELEMTYNGQLIKKTTEIELTGDTVSALIQTDRGIYKRSQTVKMRAFFLDEDMKAVKKNMTITIVDPDGNKVERVTDRTSISGVVVHEYSLSDDPKVGDWKIQVQPSDGSGKLSERIFSVDNYVLPRFSVEATASVPFVYTKDFTSLEVNVEAMYTYGEGVHGKASLKYRFRGEYKTKPSIRLVDGKVTFTIDASDIASDQNVKQYLCGARYCFSKQSYKLDLVVNVTEDETGESQQTQTDVNFYTERVSMKLIGEKPYRKTMDYVLNLHVTDPNGGPLPMSDRDYYVNMLVTASGVPVLNTTGVVLPKDTEDVVLQFTVSTRSLSSLSLEAGLFDTNGIQCLKIYDSIEEYQSYGGNGVQISLLKSQILSDGYRSPLKEYSEGETMYVHTTANRNEAFITPLFLYLFSKGNLVQSYEVSSGSTTLITVTADLAPVSSLLLISVAEKDELIADEREIRVVAPSKSQMTMNFNVEREKVGNPVTLTVNSDANSFIFLVAIDKGSHILKEPNDITESDVRNNLLEFDIREQDRNDDYRGDPVPMFRRKRQTMFYSGKGATEILEAVGIVFLTDLNVVDVSDTFFNPVVRKAKVALDPMEDGFPIMAAMPESGKTTFVQGTSETLSEASSTRKYFPETFIWLNEMTGSDGMYTKVLTLPDSITSWVTRGFSFSPSNGLAIATKTQVESFKRFFIVVSHPPFAVRGDIFEVKLVVFNYYDDIKSARVTYERSRLDSFQLYRNIDDSDPLNDDFVVDFQVPTRSSKGTNLFIKATSLGKISVKAKASSGSGLMDETDIVIKEIPIEPEGTTLYGGIHELLKASNVSQSITVYPDFPTEYVEGSKKLSVSVTGDMLGQSLMNLDSMIRVPSGCGEQNMISLVPNIYAMSYMSATNKLDPDIQTKAEQNMRKGYERELQYKHDNGGFSAFGKSDPSFSTWLTAFVMKSFAQAGKFIYIDEDVISKAKQAVLSQANANGSFNEPGRVIHKEMMSGTSGGEMLAAYIYIALKEVQKTGQSIPTSFSLSLTLGYLENFYKDASKPKTNFQLSVLSYCFALGGSQELENVLRDLNDLASTNDNGDMQCWCDLRKEENTQFPNMYRTHDVKPSTIETAAYVLLSNLERSDLSASRPIAKWLVSQINDKGGFLSTQDTVLGLQALSQFAETLADEQQKLTVSYRIPGNDDVLFAIDKTNSMLLQSESIKLNSDDQFETDGIVVSVEGIGDVIVAVSWEYNVFIPKKSTDLHIEVTTLKQDAAMSIIRPCVWYGGNGDNGMGMVYVDIPTGHSVTNMKELQGNDKIQRVDFDSRTMSFYFNQLTATKICFDIHVFMEFAVAEIQPMRSTAQFYYEPDLSDTYYYTLKTGGLNTGNANAAGTQRKSVLLICYNVLIYVVMLHLF